MVWNKKIALTLKFLIILLSIGYISIKLYKQLNSTNFQNSLFQVNLSFWWLLLVVLGLTFLNWFTESLKWQLLIKKLQSLPIKICIKGVLSGITVGIVTPNRMGEFGGRILILDRKNRVSGVFATLLGGYSQLLITICGGLIGLSFYLNKFPNQIPFNLNHTMFFLICLVVVCLCLFVYFRIEIFMQLVEYFIKQEKKKRFLYFLKDYSKIELFKVLGLSFLRYLVFTCQFYLALKFFNVQINYFDALMAISVVYFLLAVTPVISLFEFSVRSSVAVLILSVFSPLIISIISASILLWFVNVAIPALVGSVTLIKLKI